MMCRTAIQLLHTGRGAGAVQLEKLEKVPEMNRDEAWRTQHTAATTKKEELSGKKADGGVSEMGRVRVCVCVCHVCWVGCLGTHASSLTPS